MKVLIITVAGMATRFSKSIGRECLKCLYYEKSVSESLLYRMMDMGRHDIDKYIVVGGFCYDILQEIIRKEFNQFSDKIVLVKNERFSEYGSGYSLLCGLKKAFEMRATDIVFAEGDLYLDRATFEQICGMHGSIVTCSTEPILASKSVAFYYDCKQIIHYIFDTQHGQLLIGEPFVEIHNSGQVWKFSDVKRLQHICDNLSAEEEQGTNLIIIQKFFETMERDTYVIIRFKNWINCNTVEDFNRIALMEGKNAHN